jgi:Tfp pilus assembly protein PilF
MSLETKIVRLSIVAACLCGPAWAQAPEVQDLVDQAVNWQVRGRTDLARETWHKLLRVEPENPEALAGLGIAELEDGQLDAATRRLARLKQLHPDHPAAARLDRAIVGGTPSKEQLTEARRLAQAGRAEAAMERYAALFGPAKPSGDLALEYYQTVGGTRAGWPQARRGLEDLVKDNPGNNRYALALAQIYSYREETRRTAIKKLQALIDKPEVRKQAIESWRQSLVWLHAGPKDAGLYQAYLRQHPQDWAVRDRLNQPRRWAGSPRFDLRDLAKAEAGFQQRLNKQPQDAQALAGLGIVRLRQERFAEARDLLERANAAAPKSKARRNKALQAATYWALVKEADESRRAGKPEQAGRALQEAIRIDPKEPTAHVALGDALAARGEFRAAEEKYREVLGRSPQHPEALRGLINLLAQQKRDEEAVALARTLTDKQYAAMAEPKRLCANVARAQARVAQSRGDQAGARKALEDALLAEPDNPWVKLDLARFYQREGATAQARALADALNNAPAEQPEALLAGAVFSAEQRQWQEGLATLERIPPAARTSEMAQLHKQLSQRVQVERAMALARQGKEADARRALAQIEAAGSEDPFLLAELSAAYLSIGDTARAEALVGKALQRSDKPSAAMRLQHASVLLKTDKLTELEPLLLQLESESLATAERADLEELKVALALRKAENARAAGRFKEAHEFLAPPLAQHPGHAKLLLAQGQVRAAAGEKERALELYETVLKREPQNLDAHLLAIGTAMDLKDYPHAEALMADASARHPDEARVAALAGRLARAQDRNAAAMKHFERALALEGGTASPQTRTDVQRDIAELRARHSGYVAGAAWWRARRGEAGLDKLRDVELPLEASIAPGYEGRIAARAIPVFLDAGSLDLGNSSRARRFGANGLTVPGISGSLAQRESGIALGLAYETRAFGVDVGTTPIGFPVRYLVGGVRFTPRIGDTYLSFELSRRAVTESLLSYSGTRDNVTGRTWGGVRATGARIDATWDRGAHGFYGNLGYRSLTGEEVASNSVLQAGVGAYKHLLRTDDMRVTAGVDLTFLRYDKNLGFFTLGHGGYFSPQSYVHVSLPVEWTGRTRRLAYQLRGSVGVQHFRQDSAPYFPKDAALQAALEQRAALNPALGLETVHGSNSTTGLGVNLHGALEYKVSSRLFVGGTLGFDNTRDYTQGMGSVFLRYWFEPQTDPIHFPPHPVKPFFSERAP